MTRDKKEKREWKSDVTTGQGETTLRWLHVFEGVDAAAPRENLVAVVPHARVADLAAPAIAEGLQALRVAKRHGTLAQLPHAR